MYYSYILAPLNIWPLMILPKRNSVQKYDANILGTMR